MLQYFREFSFNDILSALFTALMLVSLPFCFRMFNLFDSFYIIQSITLLLPIALNHHFYLREHKRRNGFTGRLIQDLMISVFLIALLSLILKTTDTFYWIGSFSNLVFVVLFVVLIIELVLSIINWVLLKIGITLW